MSDSSSIDRKPKSLLGLVATRISSAGPTIQDRVVEVLAEKEIAVRQQHTLDALNLHEALEKQLKGVQPDQPASFNLEGVEVGPATFSKKTLENKRKLEEKITRLGTLLETALNEGKFGELQKFLNENKGQSGGQQPDQNPKGQS